MRKLPKRFVEKINFTETCWLWKSTKTQSGYGIYKESGKNIRAHRFIWRQLKGEIPEGMCILHRCDTPLCVNPGHLFIGTPKDNAEDRDKKGRANTASGDRHGSRTHLERFARGERNGNSKLTLAEVRKIRTLVNGDQSLGRLAERYSVSKSSIWRIVHGKCWAGIQ